MKQSKQIFFVAMTAMLIVVGCVKESDHSSPIAARNSRSGTAATQGLAANGASGGAGNIYTSQQYADQFSSAMGYLASASVDTGSIGAVAINGVRIWGRVELDGNTGQVVIARSAVAIEITDNHANESIDGQTVGPIRLIIPASQGQMQGDQATVTFADHYGSVTFAGSRSGQYFQGEFSFVNQNQHEGRGFSFQVPTCSFFHCQ